jgi:O-antigen ligase
MVVPFTTGFIGFCFDEGLTKLRPAYYLAGVSAAVTISLGLRRYRPSLTTALLISLLLVRLLDAAILQRIHVLIDNPASTIAVAFIFSISLSYVASDRRLVRICMIGCAISTIFACSLVNSWEWLHPGYFSAAQGRSAGWLENPNDSAMAICFMLGLLLSLRIPAWLTAPAAVMSFLGVYFSLSRTGIILLGAIGLGSLLAVLRRGLAFSISLSLLITLFGYLINRTVDFRGLATNTVAERQALFTGDVNMSLSDDARIELFREGIEGIKAEPAFGYGAGASWGMPFEPHNEYVATWLDSGILGFLLFVAGLFSLTRDCFLRDKQLLIGAVPLALGAFFSHNLLESKSFLFAWICLAGLACSGEKKHLDSKSSEELSQKPRTRPSKPSDAPDQKGRFAGVETS